MSPAIELVSFVSRRPETRGLVAYHLCKTAMSSASARTTTWWAFIRVHLALLAGTDFFTVQVLTLRELVTYYVLLFIHLESKPGNHRRHYGPPR
jgi:hypothetical protein